MNYDSIDATIGAWATRHNLYLYTTHRDEAVRSVNLVAPSGRKCQIWIDPPDSQGRVQTHLWDYKGRREDRETRIANLEACLETLYSTAMDWIRI